MALGPDDLDTGIKAGAVGTGVWFAWQIATKTLFRFLEQTRENKAGSREDSAQDTAQAVLTRTVEALEARCLKMAAHIEQLETKVAQLGQTLESTTIALNQERELRYHAQHSARDYELRVQQLERELSELKASKA